MPTYRFTAFDNSGQEHEGTLQAGSSDHAVQELRARGLRIRMLKEAQYEAPPAPRPGVQAPRPAPQAPRPAVKANPAAVQGVKQPAKGSPKTATAGPKQVVKMPSQPARPAVIHTSPGSDKDRFFLFSQIASGLKAGINPAELFNQIAPRTRGVFKDSLSRMASGAAEGIPLSTIMAQYPDLYPANVVGGVRAGEQGGFLPDACLMIAEQAERAHRFRRFFWWLFALNLQTIIVVPAILAFRVAFLAAWDAVDKRGGGSREEVVRDLEHYAWEAIRWPYGPLFLLSVATLLGVWWSNRLAATRPFRHGLAARWPGFAARSRNESLTIFSWTMSKLTAAGLPHNTAWDLAAASVPNLTVQKRLERVGQSVQREGKIADAVHESNLFPQQYAPMLATAEYTGDVPGAMEQLSRVSRGEFEASETYAKLRGGSLGCLLLFVTSSFIMIVVAYMYYHELPEHIFKDDQP